MKDSFENLIESKNSILILLPKDPYFDQVAAGLGLYLHLKEKKDAVINCPTPMIVQFNRLVGVNKITQEMGNKNLVFSLKEYDPKKIERVTYDVIDNQMKLIVIPQPGEKPPAESDVAVGYAGISADLAILIGGAHGGHFPQLNKQELKDVKLAHIGINDVKLEREVMSFAQKATSVSEIVADLIDDYSEDIATNLLLGLYAGSRNFADDNVTSATFELASRLMQAGAKTNPAVSAKKYPEGAIPARSYQESKLENPEGEKAEGTPREWTQPKIYKGTDIS